MDLWEGCGQPAGVLGRSPLNMHGYESSPNAGSLPAGQAGEGFRSSCKGPGGTDLQGGWGADPGVGGPQPSVQGSQGPACHTQLLLSTCLSPGVTSPGSPSRDRSPTCLQNQALGKVSSVTCQRSRGPGPPHSHDGEFHPKVTEKRPSWLVSRSDGLPVCRQGAAPSLSPGRLGTCCLCFSKQKSL